MIDKPHQQVHQRVRRAVELTGEKWQEDASLQMDIIKSMNLAEEGSKKLMLVLAALVEAKLKYEI